MLDSNATLKRAVALGLAVVVVASLGAVSMAQDGEETAGLRVAHMSPDAPAVDVRVDGETVAQDLDFGDVTDYLDVPAGDREVAIVTAEEESVVFEGQVTVSADENYTVVAAGEVSENGTEPFEPILLEDATEPPTGEDASVRLVHVSPDAGTVDVTVNQTGGALFEDATFGNATDYVTVQSGVYSLEVRPATEDGEAIETFNESFVNETAYTVFAAGYVSPEDAPANESLDLFVAVDRTDNPEVLVAEGQLEPTPDEETETIEETPEVDEEETTPEDEDEETTLVEEETTPVEDTTEEAVETTTEA